MRRLLTICAVFVFAALVSGTAAHGSEPGGWPGVDETVVGKFAEQGGRPAKGCILELEGDAQLFAFLCAGLAGGFAIGYFYRDFARPKKRQDGDEKTGEGGHDAT